VTVREPYVLDGEALAYARSFALVHSSVYSGTETELPKLGGAGPLVSFDLSSEAEYRTPAYLDRVCPYTDLVLLSCSDLDDAATHALLAEVVRHGARLVLATRGLAGAVVSDGQAVIQAPARPVRPPAEIVDTMGCGDAFLAGFAASLLREGWSRRDRPRAESLRRALEAGAGTAYQQCFVEAAFGWGRPSPRDSVVG
jgi:sugar/nucleoside kinase (ribokinase family)